MTRTARGPIVALVILLLLTAVVRLRVADVPLERDEGEYAYAGQLILQGVAPYSIAYNMKFPGTYYAYGALMAVFGQTAWGVHAGLVCVNLATMTVLFLLARRLFGGWPAVAAAGTFAALSMDPWMMGLFAHSTHFVALFATIGLWLLTMDGDRSVAGDPPSARLIFVAGLAFGAATVLSQQGAVFALAGAGLLWWTDGRRSPRADARTRFTRFAVCAGGILLPLVATAAMLWAQGVWPRFRFWAFDYAAAYARERTIADGLAGLGGTIAYIGQADWPMWLLAALGLGFLWAGRFSARERVAATLWLAASLVSLSIGFYFRPHYFLLALPAAALLAAAAVAGIERLFMDLARPAAGRLIAGALCVLTAVTFIVWEGDTLFATTGADLAKAVYQGNPFNEAAAVAGYIRSHTTLDDRIAVLGSEPEIYFYAHRKSATGYIYTYPLIERQPFASGMQDEMAQQVTAAHPPYIVVVGGNSSWSSLTPSNDRRIITWAADYTRACYDLVGIADIQWPLPSVLLWDDAARGYVPASDNALFTYRRKSEAPCSAPWPKGGGRGG